MTPTEQQRYFITAIMEGLLAGAKQGIRVVEIKVENSYGVTLITGPLGPTIISEIK